MCAVGGRIRAENIVDRMEYGRANTFAEAGMALCETQKIIHVDIYIGQWVLEWSQGVVAMWLAARPGGWGSLYGVGTLVRQTGVQ